MIEGFAGSILIGYLSPVALFTAAVCMLVLRAGASRVFFDIVGTFQAAKMLDDAASAATIFESLYLDAVTGIQESAMELAEIFNNVTDTVVPIARELAEAEIQLEKFLDTSEDISEMRDSVEGIGLQFGFAGDQAMQAAAKMAQISGVLGPGSLAMGTQIGMEFGLISGMETEAAMQRMINLQQQTKFMTQNLEANMTAEQRATQIRKDSMVVLDQLNTIENRSAATMEQITFVMNQFASQAHLANEEIKSMAAMSAVMIETGEEQGKGGRALKMMYARLGSDIGGARSELEKLNIQVIDNNGNMRGLSDILKELEPKFLEMEGARKQEVAQIVAGNRHYTRLLKLMDNLDRVKALELEATLAMFPAMDEINRRRESELFQLEQAEAKVRNLSAALGDELLPAMTATTNKQAMMIESFLDFTKIPILGNAALSVFGLSKAMSTLIAPLVMTGINIKSLSISMQTHQAVLRALNDPTKQLNQLMNVNNGLTKQQKIEYSALATVTKQVADAKEMEKLIEEQGVQVKTQKINELFRENMSLEEMNKSLVKNGQSYKQNEARIEANKLEMRELFMERQKLKQQIDADTSRVDDIKQAGEQAQAYNKFTMTVGGAGSALMLFSKRQSMMKAGMALNTLAMAAQISKMMGVNFNLKDMIASTKLATLAAKENIVTNGVWAASFAGVGAAASAAKAAVLSLIRSLGPLAAVAGGAMVAFKLYEDIKNEFFASAEKEKEITTDVAANMGNVADIIKDVNSGNLDLNVALEEQRKLVDNLRASNSSMMDEVLPAQEQYLADLTRTQDILDRQKTLETVDNSALQGYFDLLEEEERLNEKYGHKEKFFDQSFFQMGRSINDGRRGVERNTNAIKNFRKENEQIFEFIELHGITTMEAYNDIMESTGNGLSGAGDAASGFASDVTEATDIIDNFNNSREEMFFGFKSGNMTGDLVRQVQQQGVETLITTTEVVMTNVFNGLTIPEMADIVIGEIESRGNLSGYNMQVAV